MSGTGIIIEREYLERVRKKSFIITTLIVPLLMVAVMILPAILIEMGGQSKNQYLVIDKSGTVAPQLSDTESLTFITINNVPLDSALTIDTADGVLVIPADIVSVPQGPMKLYSRGPSSLSLEKEITSQVNSIVEKNRLDSYDIPDLNRILKDSRSDAQLSTVRISDDNTDGESTSPALSFALGMGMTFTLYMFILIYGQMVMTSIIEEKGNRVLEVVVTSVKPTRLMLGKIIGIGLVALTQILLWAAIVSVTAFLIVPALLPTDLLAEGASNAAITGGDAELIMMVRSLPPASTVSGYIVLMIIFLILGFLIYSSIFTAIGSAVDNIQDASQLSSLAVFPIVIGLIFAMVAASDPGGSIAFWASMFPLTSPMVMVARIPFGIPVWEIVLSLALLVAGLIFMAWIAGKIYRVGIFMYGKKPTLREIMRWISYK
ncbi:MAG: ABC transporter permease [Bacteroides sp.]|nr:ABC transporter permease [Bacteroides sp.]